MVESAFLFCSNSVEIYPKTGIAINATAHWSDIDSWANKKKLNKEHYDHQDIPHLLSVTYFMDGPLLDTSSINHSAVFSITIGDMLSLVRVYVCANTTNSLYLLLGNKTYLKLQNSIYF